MQGPSSRRGENAPFPASSGAKATCAPRSQPSIPSEQCSPDAGEGVEQVRSSVAPVVEHLVEGEDVVVDAVVGQVGVFDAAKGDGTLRQDQLLRGQDLRETNPKLAYRQHRISTA